MKQLTVKGLDGTLEKAIVENSELASATPAGIIADGFLSVVDTDGVLRIFFMPLWSIDVETYVPPPE